MILGVIRINIFFSPKSVRDPQYFFEIIAFNTSEEIQSPLLVSKQAQAAFAIDWIASIVPTFMGILHRFVPTSRYLQLMCHMCMCA